MTASFSSLAEFFSVLQQAPEIDSQALEAARDRNGQLTKPPGALGRLEDLAIWYAGWRGTPKPQLTAPQVVIFAGNHGVTAQGISAFPAEVTEQMVLNFQSGGAAINQLSSCFGARLDVHALQLDRPTADFTQGPAMSEDECVEALKTGWAAVDKTSDLLVTGEMGIGNTTSAAAIALALYGGSGADWAGRGTGVDDAGLSRKAKVIETGLNANPQAAGNGLEALRCLGGRELAAMVGAIAHARMLRIPVILDGFICTAAAAALAHAVPGALDHAVAGHVSAEAAHKAILDQIDKKPLLSMDMRLGEGSGAALAISMLQAAVACHSGMATFAEAGVADG
ncbi:MAG: nicotinate-nucleotide--dimethylbenzimidazole phosphoribosyltransferase [Paracoccaceae bacterium]|nr:nicotinate-nucleotide--dimethylbenzimidazole phosphoribosyltransferase [Marinovum sp.]MDG2295218.1 nicotinate-nucleotide--dimethylbenzimidazole phosphoribosyltransferase [Paracoccaceae bacterium]|tara:strand:+ start:327 stop:1343 length:1017 start_codon:yes stop_codon:yes gene_type:complete